MVKKIIITSDGALRHYEIKNLKRFNKKYNPISKVGNRLIYSELIPKKEVKVIREVRRRKIKVPVVVELPAKRIRIQMAQNFKADAPPYFVSIRAITINPIITQRGLSLALIQGKRKIQIEENINLTAMQTEYIGLEKTEIPSTEDRKLNDLRIHVEVFIAYLRGGKKILRYYIF